MSFFILFREKISILIKLNLRLLVIELYRVHLSTRSVESSWLFLRHSTGSFNVCNLKYSNSWMKRNSQLVPYDYQRGLTCRGSLRKPKHLTFNLTWTLFLFVEYIDSIYLHLSKPVSPLKFVSERDNEFDLISPY